MRVRRASLLCAAGSVLVGVALAGESTVDTASLASELSFTASTGDGSAHPGDIAPDAMGAVGTEVVVSLTNDDYGVFRKSDGTQLASDTMTGFWTAAGIPDEFAGPIDPRLLYDPGTGRFFAAAIWNTDTPPSGRVLLAVSNTSDPLDGWTGFAIPTSDGFISDQPMIGLDDEALYATTGLGFSNDVFVFPKDDLLATPASVEHATLFGNVLAARSGFQPAPVTTLDGGGLPTKLLAAGTSYFGVVQSSTLLGSVAMPSLSPNPLILIATNPKAPDAQQPGGAPPIFQDSAAGFRSSVVERGGTIWAVHTVASPAGRDAVEWIQFDAATDIVLQSGLIEDPELDFIVPSIAVNEFDEVVIGFSGTGPDQFLSAYAALGERVAGETIFGTPLLLKQGVGSLDGVDAHGRTLVSEGGATVVDPADPHAFWTFQDFGAGDGAYGVQITRIRVVPEPGTALLLACGLTGLGAARRPGSGSGIRRS